MNQWDGRERRSDNPKLDILLDKINMMEKDMAVIKSFINSENGNHIHHLDSHYKTLEKHGELLYGNGKPGIIDILTRMDSNLIHVREWSASHKIEDDKKHEENLLKFDKINKNLGFQQKVIYGALGIIGFIEFMAKVGK